MGEPLASAIELIGHTPVVKLARMAHHIPAEIWVKLEYCNPTGSVKDRIALRMIEAAESRGDIAAGATIVEPTSGNTGVGLALVCALKGYRMIAVMPEAMSAERKMLLEHMGARVEIVPSCGDVNQGFIKEDIERTLARAAAIVADIPGAWMPNQFENPDNPAAHAETTAREILAVADHRFRAFVAACGTGGTFTGVASVLKAEAPHVERIVVEPAGSAVISGGEPGFHKIQGIGEGFVPCTMDVTLADRPFAVGDDDAFVTARRLAREEGLLTGISGGANVFAALAVGATLEVGEVVITLLPDNAYRYFSTEMFER